MNDATFPFHGAVKGSLLNMQSDEEINVFEQTFSLPAGAGVRRLWCAIGSAQPAPPSDSEFVVYPGMVPTERLNFSKTMTGVSVRSCEALCHIGQCVAKMAKQAIDLTSVTKTSALCTARTPATHHVPRAPSPADQPLHASTGIVIAQSAVRSRSPKRRMWQSRLQLRQAQLTAQA